MFSRSITECTKTAADGSYRFENLEEGGYTIYASSSFSSERAVFTNVVVRSTETTIADTLQLTATGSISGKITLDNGISGNIGFLVFVAGTSFMAMTDDEGNYKITDVPAGSGYQLVVTKNGIIHNLSSNVTVLANDTVNLTTDNFISSEFTISSDTNDVDGKDGISIIWLGAFDSADEISNPKYLYAYFNKTDGCLYIYNGTEWTLLARSGANGSITLGTFLSTEELTNSNIEITVNVNQNDISKIGYVYSADNKNFNSANSIFNSSYFVTITTNSNGKYKVTATTNGYYYFAVKNNKSYTAFTEEYITNIDKTAPSDVSSLISKYNKNTKDIYVTWENPTDEDFDFISLSYTKDDNLVVSDKHIKTNTYSVSNVEVDGKEYVFSIVAFDKMGNRGNISITKIIPLDGVSIQSIILNRYHISCEDPDQTINATAILSNIELLDDETTIKFQTKDSGGNLINTTANIDKSVGKATATITIPSLNKNNSENGETFTIMCKIGEDMADTKHTARFNVSAPAKLSQIQQYINGSEYSFEKVQVSLQKVTSSLKENIRISG